MLFSSMQLRCLLIFKRHAWMYLSIRDVMSKAPAKCTIAAA